MKRILLTPHVERLAEDYLRDLKNLADSPIARLERLEYDFINVNLPSAYVDYIEAIINNYDDIITKKPNTFCLIDLIFARFNINLSQKITINITQSDHSTKSKTQSLYMFIVDAMAYDDVQEKIFPKYVKRLGIKSCVYCNAQYAISSKKGKSDNSNRYRANYNIDHNEPKSKKPYLSTSFFNLYPSCPSCNQTKSYKPSIYNLYILPSDSRVELNPYFFYLDKASILRYNFSGNSDDLNISLKQKTGVKMTPVSNFDEYFHINKIYANFNDTVEEMIWKYRTRNTSFIESCKDAGFKFLNNKCDFGRFIFGNYTEEKDILKRPLAKLVQDIGKQLGMLP